MSGEFNGGPRKPSPDVLAALDHGPKSEDIPVLRGQIDALDLAITRLVAERARLSSSIQKARVNNGGTRVELGREREIMSTYRDALGPNGPDVADSILQICRGPIRS